MKKLFILAIGFVLVASAVIFLPEASRDAYHTYLIQKANESRENRRFAERNASGEIFTYKGGNTIRTGRIPIRNLRYPSGTKRYIYSRANTYYQSARVANRPMSYSIGLRTPSYLYSTSNRKFITKPFAELSNNWVDYYNATDYVLKVPAGAELDTTENILSFNGSQNVKISITKIEEKEACVGGNFFSCARGVIATENRAKERQVGRSNEIVIERKSGYSNNFSEMGMKSEYHTKTGIFFSTKGEEFVTQKVVRGLNGELFLIDISSPKADAHYTIPFAKRIFDTFHILQD